MSSPSPATRGTHTRLRHRQVALPPGSPGQAAGVAEPALLLRVGVAAAFADEEVALQTLPPAVHEEPVGLQAAGTVSLIQVGCVRQQLPLGALLLYLAFQPPWENVGTRNASGSLFLQVCECTV